MKINIINVTLCALVAIILVAAPFVVTPVVNDWMMSTAGLLILAVSWNMAANAGLISLGHSAFWGVGSYAALLVAHHFGLTIFVSLVPAILVGGLLGAGLALITGRLRGIFFAISTLALSEGLRVLALMTPKFTGGGEGMYIAQNLRPQPHVITAIMVAGAMTCIFIAWAVSRSRYQYAMRAMRAKESASQMLGVNPLYFRVLVLALSGAMTSFAGGIKVWYGGFLDPHIAFDLHITILAQIAPILGGIHTLVGPIIGALLASGLAESTRILLGEKGLSMLVYGAVLVLSILYMPQGIWGMCRDYWLRVSGRRREI